VTSPRDFAVLPKIDLHRHLEGSVRFETLRELTREVGLRLTDRELRRRATMRGERPGFRRFLSKFEIYRGLYPSREWIERVAFEAAEDARKDGVIYLELRFSPAHFARRMKAKGEDVAEWISGSARKAGIGISFIATFGRHFSLAENRPTFRAVEGTKIFSGLDIAGDEGVSARPFLPFFRKMGLPVTIHAGEAGGAGNVREAIEVFGARRIGHGVRVLEEAEVVRLARDRDTVFEICLTSEIQTGAAPSWRRHPVRAMLEAGLKVTLNTDDPAVCGVTLSGEFRRLRLMGLTGSPVGKAMRISALSAFLPRGTRARLERRILREWRIDD
jgi:adenosine deaminase